VHRAISKQKGFVLGLPKLGNAELFTKRWQGVEGALGVIDENDFQS